MMLPEDLGITPDLGWPVEVRLGLSVVLLGTVIGLRWLIVYEIRRHSEILSDRQRWWITAVRNTASALMVVGLIWIWADEISQFALSITAFALALVIATKELLLSISGAIWRGTALPFGVGDWVEIGEYSGEVIDENLLTTTLQEIGREDYRFTGRTVAVPNALLLTQPTINHNFRKRFVLHEFRLVAPPDRDAERLLAAVRAALDKASAEFADLGRRYAALIEKSAGTRLPPPEPSVTISTNEYANLVLRCFLFCPRERAEEVEQAAARAFAAELGGGVAG